MMTRFIKQYLCFQGLFLLRGCAGIGLVRTLFLLTIVILGFVVLSTYPSWYSLIIFFFLVFFYNSRKKDRDFLKSIVGMKYKVCYFALYFMISLPFLAISVANGEWYEVLLYPFLVAIVSFSPTISGTFHSLKVTHPLMCKESYEYVEGFRSCWLAYVAVLFFSMLGAYHGNIQISKVMTILVCFMLVFFHSLEYRREYVLNYPKAISVFLFKIRHIVLNNVIWLLPFMVLIVAFSPTFGSLRFCLVMALVSMISVINALSIRILFERQDLITVMVNSLLYVLALTSIKCHAVLMFCLGVLLCLSVLSYNKIKKITRL